MDELIYALPVKKKVQAPPVPPPTAESSRRFSENNSGGFSENNSGGFSEGGDSTSASNLTNPTSPKSKPNHVSSHSQQQQPQKQQQQRQQQQQQQQQQQPTEESASQVNRFKAVISEISNRYIIFVKKFCYYSYCLL